MCNPWQIMLTDTEREAISKRCIAATAAALSAKSPTAWLDTFDKGSFRVHAYDSVGGKPGGKHLKFAQTFCGVLTGGGLPALVFPKVAFKALAKKDFDKAEMGLIGTKPLSDTTFLFHCYSKRFNRSGNIFQELGVLYELSHDTSGQWKVSEFFLWDGPNTPPAEFTQQFHIDLSTFNKSST